MAMALQKGAKANIIAKVKHEIIKFNFLDRNFIMLKFNHLDTPIPYTLIIGRFIWAVKFFGDKQKKRPLSF